MVISRKAPFILQFLQGRTFQTSFLRVCGHQLQSAEGADGDSVKRHFFLEKGIAEGKLSNSYPFILDESYCQEAGALVRRDQVELHAPPRPKSPPGPPPKATPSAPSTASSSFVN